MEKVKLKNGFTCEIDETILEDMELVEALADAEGANPLRIVDVVRTVLGEEQKKALYDHVRTENGRVPVDVITDCIMEIFENMGEDGKNS